MNAFLDHLLLIARGVAAVAGAWLPRRRWDAIPALPIEQMAAASGLVSLMTGVVVGCAGFIEHAQRAADRIADATLEIAAGQARGVLPGEITTTTMQGVSALSVVSFLFLTPLGLLAIYLTVTGILRAAAAHVDDPVGDPVLTAIDALLTQSARGTREARARRARERAEGAEVPDRLLPASAADVAGFDLLVVASRRKPDWTPGTFVITSDKWYTLGEAFEVSLPEGLRTVYPLKEQKTTEVLRRGVEYEMPPLGEGRLPVSRRRG